MLRYARCLHSLALTVSLPPLLLLVQVLGTAMVTEDAPSKAPPHSAVAVATITATCGVLLDGDNGGGSAPSGQAPGSGSEGATDGKITVTLGDVNSKPVENVVWRLTLSPNGMTGNKVTKPADGSVDLKFDVVHSRSVETVSCAGVQQGVEGFCDQRQQQQQEQRTHSWMPAVLCKQILLLARIGPQQKQQYPILTVLSSLHAAAALAALATAPAAAAAAAAADDWLLR
jgi:hypothetical protein